MIPNPLSWLRSAAGVVRQSDKSSGFQPMIVFFLLCLAAAIPLLIWNKDNLLVEIFALATISIPLLCFVVLFSIKAFTDPNFCRSERHVERLVKMEMEMMGTEKLAIPVEQIEAEKLHSASPQISDPPKLRNKNSAGNDA